MACISPPELTDLQLYMALEDDADAQVMAHLATCLHCQQRAQTLEAAQNQLKSQLKGKLFRPFCPEPEVLRDYHFELLTQAEMEAVAQHLSFCPHCQDELSVDYAQIMSDAIAPAPAASADPSNRPGPIEQIQVWVAKLLDSSDVGWTPAFGLRQSGKDQESRIYRVGDIQISLEFEPSFKYPDELMLVGLISGMEITQMEAHLWCDGALVATTLVDGSGSFEFPDAELTSGAYELFLNGPGIRIHLPDVSTP